MVGWLVVWFGLVVALGELDACKLSVQVSDNSLQFRIEDPEREAGELAGLSNLYGGP